jgi:hypothetical protein
MTIQFCVINNFYTVNSTNGISNIRILLHFTIKTCMTIQFYTINNYTINSIKGKINTSSILIMYTQVEIFFP